MTHFLLSISILALSLRVILTLGITLPNLQIQPDNITGLSFQPPAGNDAGCLSLTAGKYGCIPGIAITANASSNLQNDSSADALPPNPFRWRVDQYDACYTICRVPGSRPATFRSSRVIVLLRKIQDTLRAETESLPAGLESLVPNRKFEVSDMGMMWKLFQDDTTTIGVPALTYEMVATVFSGFAILVSGYQGYDIRAYNFILAEMDPSTGRSAYRFPVGIGKFNKAVDISDSLAEE